MGITAKQLELRRKTLGSSDMAAVLGVSPFQTEHDIYLEKTQDLEPLVQTDAMARGNYLERALLHYAADELGAIIRNQRRIVRGHRIAANIDAVVIETGEPIEAKSFNFYSGADWGKEGTDQVPLNVIVQCHVHMIALKAEVCHVPVVGSSMVLQMFRVSYNENVANAIFESADEFWSNVESGTPPDSKVSIETSKRVKRISGKSSEVSSDLVWKWAEAGKAKKKAVDQEKLLKAMVLQSLGDGEISQLIDGVEDVSHVTFYEQGRSSIDNDKLKKEFPDAYKACMKTTTHRVLRKKKTPLLLGSGETKQQK